MINKNRKIKLIILKKLKIDFYKKNIKIKVYNK